MMEWACGTGLGACRDGPERAWGCWGTSSAETRMFFYLQISSSPNVSYHILQKISPLSALALEESSISSYSNPEQQVSPSTKHADSSVGWSDLTFARHRGCYRAKTTCWICCTRHRANFRRYHGLIRHGVNGRRTSLPFSKCSSHGQRITVSNGREDA